MPTTRPRYQVTDTGRVRHLLDLAAIAWPEDADDRKALLIRLAETGAQHLSTEPSSAPLADRLRPHAGRWVAIRDDRLLHAAADAGAVARWLTEHGERADQLYRVPREPGEVGGEHGLRP